MYRKRLKVFFSIFRKKVKRGLSPMQPDGVHFHMLIYKRFAKSNAKTSVWILALYMPFVILSVVFAHQSFVLIALSFVFVVLYQVFYRRLVAFRF